MDKVLFEFKRLEFEHKGAGETLYFCEKLPIPLPITQIYKALNNVYENQADYTAFLGKDEAIIIKLWWKSGLDLTEESVNAISIEDHNEQTLKIEMDEKDVEAFIQEFVKIAESYVKNIFTIL